jgi:galactokinase
VTEHSDYKQDSVVSETINYDLLKLIQEKTEKCETPEDLLDIILK